MSDETKAEDPTLSGGPLYEGWAALACAVVAIGMAAALIVGGRDFCLDDAWIHLSYAKSLRLGDGISYNPGDWETGFSSPMWVLLLSVWPTGPDPVIPVKLLGSLLHGLTAFFASTIAMDLAKARASLERPVPLASIALFAGVLTAASPTLLQGAVSGMEIPLASAAVLATGLAMIRRAVVPAALAGAVAVLCRPEALFFVLACAGALWWRRRDRLLIMAPAGAIAGMGAWVIYCFATTGHAWPNTAYIKASEPGFTGLVYLSEHVLPWQPWLVGLTGVGLLVLALRQEHREEHVELSALMIGWLACLLATAVSRPFSEGSLFYESRYFTLIAAVPLIPIALAMVDARRKLVVILAIPIAIITGLQVDDVRGLLRAQEDDIWRLHSTPAKYIQKHLPPDSVVAVEGAGALRYHTPRRMTIVDIIGLNDAGIAHARSDTAKACAIIDKGPTHFVLPEHIAANLSKVFEFKLLQTFEDPSYSQVEVAHPMRVLLFEGTPRSAWAERCGSPASG